MITAQGDIDPPKKYFLQVAGGYSADMSRAADMNFSEFYVDNRF